VRGSGFTQGGPAGSTDHIFAETGDVDPAWTMYKSPPAFAIRVPGALSAGAPPIIEEMSVHSSVARSKDHAS
jgi:hypothetical protein